MKRKELITYVIEKVREKVSISQEIGYYVRLKRIGTSYTCPCPFHGGSKNGQFSVSESKKIWKCFYCGEKGDVITFVSKMERISYVEAAFRLALKYGFINKEEYNSVITGDTKSLEILSKEVRKVIVAKPKEVDKIADIEMLDSVYRIFSSSNELMRKNRLSNEHLKMLKEERFLSEGEIEEIGYFTFPQKYALKHFLNALEEEGLDSNVLKEVPGFYYDEIAKSWDFTKIKNGCLGIPIRDELGRIERIQLRANVSTDTSKKYIWFSSSFANDEKNKYLKYGSGGGVPFNVIIPKEIKTGAIFIVEGHFKALRTANTFGAVAIAFQGSNAWSGIDKKIEKVREYLINVLGSKFKHNNIFITFDGDISTNPAVFRQAINMGATIQGIDQRDKTLEELRKDIELSNPELICYYSVWDMDLGKGIDDLIDNGNVNMLDKLSLQDMINGYEDFERDIREIFIDTELYNNIFSVPKENLKDVFDRKVLKKSIKYIKM